MSDQPEVRGRFDATGMRFLITGASGIIGRALVRRVVAAGGTAIAVVRRPRAVEDIPGVITRVADLSEKQGLEHLLRDPELADIDVLVNNAGHTALRDSLLDTSPESIDLIHAVNVRAPVMLAQHVVRCWRASGRSGSIVNLSSPGAARAHEDQAVYDGSKGAIEALTRAMAVEWGPYSVRVNALAPARVVGDERVAVGDAPLGVSTSADDVADAVLWLASDAAGVITGQVLALDGGLLARLRPAALPEQLRGTSEGAT